mgnify:CR=1 FL=1
MLNKVNSFLIILIILYVTFKYCDLYEGQSDTYAGRQGNTEGDDDASEQLEECSGGQKKTFEGGSFKPCQYRENSCLVSAQAVSKKWDQYRENSTDHNGSLKYNCSKCVQGSDIDGSIRYYLANVGTDVNGIKKVSKFADDLCDGMAADCDDAFFYALNKQNWWLGDCEGVTMEKNGKVNITLCTFFGSSFISFVTGFLGGITCNLKIRALELEQSIMNAWDTVTKPLDDIADFFS